MPEQPPWVEGDTDYTAADMSDLYDYLSNQARDTEEGSNWGSDENRSSDDSNNPSPESGMWRAILGSHLVGPEEERGSNNNPSEEREDIMQAINDNKNADIKFANQALFGQLSREEINEADTYTLLKAGSEFYNFLADEDGRLDQADQMIVDKIKSELYNRGIGRDHLPSTSGPNIVDGLNAE